jgi:hypothetical protein
MVEDGNVQHQWVVKKYYKGPDDTSPLAKLFMLDYNDVVFDSLPGLGLMEITGGEHENAFNSYFTLSPPTDSTLVFKIHNVDDPSPVYIKAADSLNNPMSYFEMKIKFEKDTIPLENNFIIITQMHHRGDDLTIVIIGKKNV